MNIPDLTELARRWAPTHPLAQRGDMSMPDGLSMPASPEDTDPNGLSLGDPDEEQHTGVMVALYPTGEAADALGLCCGDSCTGCSGCPDCPDVAEGVTCEADDELHLTLVFLGELGESFDPARSDALLAAVEAWAKTQSPIDAKASGIGLFDTPDGVVTYASVDAKELPTARQSLTSALASAGIESPSEHGFTPHITLCYGDCRGIELPSQPLTFGDVSVVIGGVRTDIPLGVPSNNEDMSQLDSLGRPKARVHVSEPVIQEVAHAVGKAPEAGWSFVTTVGGRTVVTAGANTVTSASQVWGKPLNPNPHMLWIEGRFVGAESPNRNNAYWSSGDLEMGQPTVTHGPLNWLHEERHVIGTIADSRFIPRAPMHQTAVTSSSNAIIMSSLPQKAAETPDPHIVVSAAVWRWIYPEEASVVEMASEAGALAASMECISERVGCVGVNGCGHECSYDEYQRGMGCGHMMQHSSVRRFINPTFLGGAVIVPPARPGWADADMRTVAFERRAGDAFDEAGRPDIASSKWEQIVAGAVRYASSLT